MVRIQQLKNMTNIVICLGMICALPTVSMGDFLVTYDFDPVITGDDADAVTATYNENPGYSGSGDHYSNDLGATAAATIDLGAYISFSAGPSGSDALDFTSLTIDLQSTTASSVSAALQTSQTGLTSSDPIFYFTPAGGLSRVYVNVSADLSDSSFRNVTSDTEFRIYLYFTDGSGSAYGKVDNTIELAGAVAPEPATLMLMGVGGLLMAKRRRG